MFIKNMKISPIQFAVNFKTNFDFSKKKDFNNFSFALQKDTFESFLGVKENKKTLTDELTKRLKNEGYGDKEIEESLQIALKYEDAEEIIEKGFVNGSIATIHRWAYSYNDKLRYNKPTPIGVYMLDICFDKLPETESEMTVYRGLKTVGKTFKNYAQELKTKNVGETFYDNGFAFSSFDNEVADYYSKVGDDGVLLEIKIPKGAKVSYCKDAFLSECLFKRNSEFKILKKTEKDGLTKLVVEYILPKD